MLLERTTHKKLSVALYNNGRKKSFKMFFEKLFKRPVFKVSFKNGIDEVLRIKGSNKFHILEADTAKDRLP